MPINDSLGTRMKTFYESVPKYKLYRRTPVALRLDGRAFHTFTRGFRKPFDEVLGNAMVKTMEYLCENIQGCIFGYTQSDEITLLLIDYQTFETDAWFDYEVQKLCSISASMATMVFNKFFMIEVSSFKEEHSWTEHALKDGPGNLHWDTQENYDTYCTYLKAYQKGGMFDSRCFNIPKEEATNLIYWRQLDAQRNSIQMVGQAYFSHGALQNRSCNEIQDMLMDVYQINWNNFPVRWKRGVAWSREIGVDYNMPMLKGDNREYLDKLIYVGD